MTTDASTEGPYLPNIHHYCHRFCERCPFTEMCSFYASTKETRKHAMLRLEFPDLEAVFAEYPDWLASQLIGLEAIARRLGSRSSLKRRQKLRPPLSFPLVERSSVISRRLKRLEQQALMLLERFLTRIEATYETLGQVTVDSRRLLVGHEAMMTLGWYRAIFPMRLKQSLEALWLERRESTAAGRARLRHEATGFAMAADDSLLELRQAIETLTELYPELGDDGRVVLEETLKLRRTLTALVPQLLRLRQQPHWWVSYAAQDEGQVASARDGESLSRH